jgi:hypothetical protein
MLANAGVYGKRACREATEWRFVPKVIKGGSAEVWKGNVNVARREVRDHAGLNQASVSHGPVTVECPERGRLREVVWIFGVVEWAMGRETFVQVGRWQGVRVMGVPVGFPGRSRVRSDREGGKRLTRILISISGHNASILPRSPPI